jgi:transposase
MSAVDPSVCASACANPARLSPTPTQRRRADIKKLHRQVRDPKVDLWSLDECLFQQHGTRSLMWVPPEQTNPVLLHAPTRKSVALFGAVNLRQGQLVTQPEPKFDGLSFGRFLRHLLPHRARGRRLVLILDNAPYHHARLLQPFRREHRRVLRFDYLPRYSPELNPIERVWEAGASTLYPQPVLSQTSRSHRCGLASDGRLAKNRILRCLAYAALLKTVCLAPEFHAPIFAPAWSLIRECGMMP